MYRALRRKLSACIRRNDSIILENDDEICESITNPTIKYENEDIPSITVLNDECLLMIFSYLHTNDISRLERVCHRWKDLSYRSWRSVKYLECNNDTWYVNKNTNPQNSYMGKGRDHLVATLKKCGHFIEQFDLQLNSYSAVLLLTAVTQNCDNLLNININTELYPIKLSEIQICDLLKSSKKLKYFSIDGDYTSSPIFISCDKANNGLGTFLRHLSADTLERIHIGDICNEMKPFLIPILREFKCLKSFVCAGKVDYDEHLMRAIMSNKSLEHLCLSFNDCQSPKFIIPFLRNLTNLKNLILSHIFLRNRDLIGISNNCEQLELLDISGCARIKNIGASSIIKQTRLKILNITGLYSVTDEFIGDLSDSLTTLKCIGCKDVRDHGIIMLIRRASNLKYLDLTGCRITNATIQAAIEITTKRENNIKLVIVIRNNPFVDMNEFMELPSLLQIVTK
ncbi:hypothetical protein PV327_008495 [Microctonus hyperodae]|uniref:F-box domain-containing protein n=1 Tax=Microctonus hyperodae TaxID=165561 RepID=A0AA39F3A7_MICHY|nr:hypothetical protein PV327_008495 [Microctonus hyperodae]